ncbi:GIY-YIG nuclease family protein [Actinomadura roseirufa]|uniref:GIY-YIG nuclease family protein n=1 Tax=Actinomadura roseirufa TaxID=2094049 RepID=UPI0010417826|nr:GIY-YIG nuclease family protein [Actinomadura roseirufa]
MNGPWPDDGRLPPPAAEVSFYTAVSLKARAAKGGGPLDQLYVLEYQGPKAQYIKFGHTKRLAKRLREFHIPTARHGWALLNGWATPPVEDARPLETLLLSYAQRFEHQRVDAKESFFGMPYKTGLYLTWSVFCEVAGKRPLTSGQ